MYIYIWTYKGLVNNNKYICIQDNKDELEYK